MVPGIGFFECSGKNDFGLKYTHQRTLCIMQFILFEPFLATPSNCIFYLKYSSNIFYNSGYDYTCL